MATTVNYDDKRLTNVENQKTQALSDVEKTYGGMINKAGTFYDKQIDAVEKYGDKQTEIQKQQTDFALEKIQQQKDQAHKEYLKEQSGAYTDWQKQSNQYGANAEAMAAQGLAGAGYSESSQVAMYNTWQQRVVANRELYQRAVLDYDNQMTEARLQNSAALAEIAFNTLKEKLQLGLEGFQYENQLIIEKANKKLDVGSEYHRRYMDVLGQINEENRLAEEQRQYNKDYALREKEYEEGVRQFEKELALAQAELAEKKRQFNVANSSSGSSVKSAGRSATKTVKNAAKKAGEAVKKASGGKTVKPSSSGTTGKSDVPDIDMQSVLSLGYGPISAKKLDELLASGKAVAKERNGKLYFSKK